MQDLLRGLSDVLAFPVTATVNVAVALWLLAGLTAARWNVAGWWRRRLVLERAIARELTPREIELARQRAEAELVALLVQLAFLTAGVLVATAPPPPPPPPGLPPPAWQTLMVAPVLLSVQFAMAFESWRQNRYDRRRRQLPPLAPVDQEQHPEGGPKHDDADNQP